VIATKHILHVKCKLSINCVVDLIKQNCRHFGIYNQGIWELPNLNNYLHIYAKLSNASYFIYLFKVRTILDPVCCCVRTEDTLSYNTLHGALSSGFWSCRHSVSKKIRHLLLLWNPQDQYRGHKSAPLVPVQRHMTAIHTPTYAYAF
jgi:hypothetical protein